MSQIEDGDFMAIDVSGVNVGLLGSENTLRGLLAGCRGYVLNGSGIRDTDEVILQKIPVWSHFIAQSMVQCKIQFDAKDIPIAIGGVTIYPGDIIVADGDGVIVVPRKVAREVAKYANKILEEDKDTRKASYEELNWELDETVTK
jgi:regulator of RNase E activity RraA